MGTINVYHDEDNKTYRVNVILKQGFLSPENDTGGVGLTDAAIEFYLEITTDIRKIDGTRFPTFIVRSLLDVAPGAAAATNWTDFINDYVDYFLVAAEMGMSSSSTSSTSSSSSEMYSNSSSSSSSMNYSGSSLSSASS